MNEWLLCVDEQGTPESTQQGSSVLVGGVLVPASVTTADASWREALRSAGLPTPLHMVQHVKWWKHPARRRRGEQALREGTLSPCRVARAASGADALWLFVLGTTEPQDSAYLYSRMIGELTALAIRLVAARNGGSLSVRAGTRNLPGTRHTAVADRIRAEIRQTAAVVAQEPTGPRSHWPACEDVEVQPSLEAESHAGLWLADVGCYAIGRILAGSRDWTDAFDTSRNVLVVSRRAIRSLGDIDRALRSPRADVGRAAELVAGIAAELRGASGELSSPALGHDGALAAARLLWERGIAGLGDARHKDRAAYEALAWKLLGYAQAELRAKTGDYEGAWLALDAAWTGDNTFAVASRSTVQDRRLAAQLWRLTLECANHRGDIHAAERAKQAFDDLVTAGPTAVLVAERLEVGNLYLGEMFNRLPARVDELPGVVAAIRRESLVLQKTAAAVSSWATKTRAGTSLEVGSRPRDLPLVALERSLRKEGGAEPLWRPTDEALGKCLGSVARMQAFLGRLRDALRTAVRARTYFASEADLSFNANVIGRIAAEGHRLGDVTMPGGVLATALALASTARLLDPREAAEALQGDKRLRFDLDLLLRSWRWAPRTWDGEAAWLDALRSNRKRDLRMTLATYRSHPTELVARHAAELLRRAGDEVAARRWFDLAIEVAEENRVQDGTMQRLGEFTRRLREDPSFVGEGRAGTVLNPTFEYR